MKRFFQLMLPATLALSPLTKPAAAQTIEVIHSFPNSGTDSPRNPNSDLIVGPDGNLYGTTPFGGSGSGTVFRITTGGTFTIVANIDNSTSGPSGSLLLGPDGNLYGTTTLGGPGGGGTVFKLTTDGVMTNLYAFAKGSDGGAPEAGLALGPDGCFYGSTTSWGTNGAGTLFKVTTNGLLTTLFTFDQLTGPSGSPVTNASGAAPHGHLMLGPDGGFYGTTFVGGQGAAGTVFRYTTNGDFTVLATFYGTNGFAPESALTLGPDGNLYGTTSSGGGIYNAGTVFRLTTNGMLTTILSFAYNTPGYPETGVVFGPDGNMYGAAKRSSTIEAGAWGAVFRLTTSGILNTLANFYQTNGFQPNTALTLGPDGYFYGCTQTGGNQGSNPSGVIYRLNLGTAFVSPSPRISISRMSGGTTILSITNVPGSTNRLWATTNLSQPMQSWQVISTNIATNGFFQFTDTSGYPLRFYRVSTP